ncbi:hypothetical protein CCR93_06250 [Rhodobium orientis]|nr:hypothetical protein [Rhodobium orientis]
MAGNETAKPTGKRTRRSKTTAQSKPTAAEPKPAAPAADPPAGAPGDQDDAASRTSAGAVLVVTGPQQGRRRAGRRFGPVPVRIAAVDLSEVEREAIENDPELSVSIAED